ncbi:MAG: hypothetical protein C0615_06660 [Desulfuromonas sp.]|nr:MAG: hypothetical protein C0615_06660 [Desulfuromonas sp.]
MMKRWKEASLTTFRFITIALLLCVLPACQEKSEPESAGRVEANAAYRQYFGEPPTPTAGQAYARVAYLPLHEDSFKVRAVPLYLFTSENQVEKIITRLIDGTLILPPEGDTYNPFPAGVEVSLSQQGSQLAISLELPSIPTSGTDAIISSLVETATQFDSVETVLLRFNGKEITGMPPEGFRSGVARVVEVGPPTLLVLAAIADEGEDALEEIVANFDRPVTVNRLRLLHVDGSRVDGAYFTSVFQMAVVVHPERAETYAEGDMFVVEWDVTDALDRRAAGRKVMPLRWFEHEAELGSFSK